MGCMSGTPLSCDDGDVCNGDETCDPAMGCMAGTALDCDNGDACDGTETCDPIAGCVPGTALNCDDGNVCNGDETCDPAMGCMGGTPITCDDGVACTIDGCDPATGCTATEDDTACDTGNPCVSGLCDAATGCVEVDNDGADCSDGNECTMGDVCGSGACNAGSPVECDDGNDCTDDSCDPASGCINAPNSDPCDDGDACTLNDACSGGACVPGAPDPGCGASAWCEISGAAGSTFDCPIEIAAISQAKLSPSHSQATGLQFEILFDTTLVSPVNFFSDICFPAAGCFELAVSGAGSFPLSSGHSFSINPNPVTAWNAGGKGGVVIVNLSNPSAPLTNAYLDADGTTVVGTADFALLRFTLDQDIDPATPALIDLNKPLAANGVPNTLDTALNAQGVIITECPVEDCGP
jgi:hypothetical protein